MLDPVLKKMLCITVPVPFLASMRRIRQISRTIVVKYIWGQMLSVIRHCPLQAWGYDRSVRFRATLRFLFTARRYQYSTMTRLL